MQRNIKLEEFEVIDCTLTIKETELSGEILFPQDKEGKLLLASIKESISPKDLVEAEFITFTATNKSLYSMALTLEFWDSDNNSAQGDLISTIGLLPGVKTTITFPLTALNSQNMFLDRTPGKLKTVIHGNKINSLAKLAVGKKAFSFQQSLELSEICLTDSEPIYELPSVKLVDELGQWSKQEWQGKSLNIDEVKTYLDAELKASERNKFIEDWNTYGSNIRKQFDATGYFRAQKDGDNWWLVDPDGYTFFSVGVDCINPGDGCNIKGIEAFLMELKDNDSEYHDAWINTHTGKALKLYNFSVANLISSYGDDWEEKWSHLTRNRLIKWGINTIANWSSLKFIKYAKLPYVLPLKDFPETTRKIFRDFPDVFSEEYKRNSESFAAQIMEFAEDKYMIGYFLRNEPTWAFIKGINIAEELLENPGTFYSKDACIDFLKERYNNDIKKLNASWNIVLESFEELKTGIRSASKLSPAALKDLKDFSKIMIELYVKIPSQALKKLDPNHLNLGMRYGYISSPELLAGCDNFDVFSVNCYDVNPIEAIENIGKQTDLPVMIGEFHFGALDKGLSATGIRGVMTQKDRGDAYRYYLENAASSNYCVGAHYFQYNDQPALGRFDGENYQIGLVDVCQKPYDEFIQAIIDCSTTIYDVKEGKKEKYNKHPAIIHPIFF